MVAAYFSSGGGNLLDARISTVIGSIYERIHAGDSLGAVAEAVLDEVGGAFGLVAVADCGEQNFQQAEYLLRASSRHLDTVREYEAEMQPTDPVFRYIRRNPQANFFCAAQHVGRDEHETAPYFRWTRDRFGTTDWMIAFTPPNEGLSFGATAHARPGSQFEEGDRRLFRMLFDHMERAVRLSQRPLDLASHDTAVLLLSPSAGLIGASAAAGALLSQGDALTISGGVVLPKAGQLRRSWLATLRGAADAVERGTGGGMIALPREFDRRPLIATIEPLPRPFGSFASSQSAVLVRIADPEIGPGPDAARRWALAFRFTPAETRLCEALLRCTGSLREAAGETGIAYATARVHLASIFQKTDTRSQSALVGLLTRTGQSSSRV